MHERAMFQIWYHNWLSTKNDIRSLQLFCFSKVRVYKYVCIFVCIGTYFSFSICLKDYIKNQAEAVVAKGRPN